MTYLTPKDHHPEFGSRFFRIFMEQAYHRGLPGLFLSLSLSVMISANLCFSLWPVQALAQESGSPPIKPPAKDSPRTASPGTNSQGTDPAKTLDELKILYEKTCTERAYGSYDDICQTLGDQIKTARKALSQEMLKKTPPQNQTPSLSLDPKTP